MGNFFKGLLFGIGIALLIAPRRGQEQRRFLGERLQKLRGYLSGQAQSHPVLQQATDRIAQTTGTVKDAAAQATNQVKETIQKAATQPIVTQAKEAVQNATQKAPQVKEAAQNTLGQAVTQTKETVQNATRQATTQETSSNRKNASEDIVEVSGPDTTQQSIQSPLSSATTTSRNGREDAGLNTPLSKIPGMEPEPQSELEALGIHTTGQLLEQTATKEMRTDLAQKIGISAHMLRTLIDRADLMRLPGVGSEMATLLEEAGVNGCKDLQRRNPEHLYATLTGMQESSKSASLTPNLDELTQWIAEATAATNSAYK